MRGLKHGYKYDQNPKLLSHLLQMRGLKQIRLNNIATDFVASFTDAWIETINDFRNVNAYQVASFTDAWIETCIICRKRKANASHLLQMRGLKLLLLLRSKALLLSHLLQMRGLKRSTWPSFRNLSLSHLLQMRGLKHYISTCFVKHIVASFTDAWIETDLILTSWR